MQLRRMCRVAAFPLLLSSALIVGMARAQTPTQQDHPGAPPPPQFHRLGGAWDATPGLRLADRFATLEVYLGITPQQQDAWRAFTQAALAMVPSPEEMRRDAGGGAFDAIEHMTARMQDMATKAQNLEQTAQALQAVLTPEQIQKADAAWATLRAAREHRTRHWMRDNHEDH